MSIEIRRKTTMALLHTVPGSDLSDANLRYADLRDASLRGANLRDADLRYAELRDADLRGANLRYADLRGANLRGADLHGAYLIEASLRGADLRGANLHGASLRGANLRGAYLSGPYVIDAGADDRGYRFVGVQHTDRTRIYAGCRAFTIAEAFTHWQARHLDDPALHTECLAKVTYIETVARARGWAL